MGVWAAVVGLEVGDGGILGHEELHILGWVSCNPSRVPFLSVKIKVNELVFNHHREEVKREEPPSAFLQNRVDVFINLCFWLSNFNRLATVMLLGVVVDVVIHLLIHILLVLCDEVKELSCLWVNLLGM